MIQQIIEKYLQCEEKEPCYHCHKNTPEKGTVCNKCKKELEAFRNKNKPKEEKE